MMDSSTNSTKSENAVGGGSSSSQQTLSKSSKKTDEDRSLRSLISVDSADEFYKAKSYLMKASSLTDSNIYDHLTELIGKILEGRPENVVDYFEEMSIWLKKSKLQYKDDSLLESSEASTKFVQAQKDKKLFQGGFGDVSGTAGADDEDMAEEERAVGFVNDDASLPNLQEQIFFFEQAGLTLNHDEIYRINLSLKLLVQNYPIRNLRLWGKIIGLEHNYIIVETVFRAGEEFESRKKESEDDVVSQAIFETHSVENQHDKEEDPPLPKSRFKPPTPIQIEPFRTGANKHVYFACSAPDFTWTKLPLVTPDQINVARLIRKYFTGHFDAPITSFPPFPGKEIHYLRAQIARISAATMISPLGFYNIATEEEDGVLQNENYEPIRVSDLVDSVLDNWVHHSKYLLPQGRCTWFNPKLVQTEPAESEEVVPVEEEEQVETETGPTLLSPIAGDLGPDGIQTWIAHTSPSAFPQHSVAVVQSYLWPGAYAICKEKKLVNIYFGYGIKYNIMPFNPLPPPTVMQEYPAGPNLFEAMDPTPEEEAVFKEQGEGVLATTEDLEEEEVE